MSKKEEKSKKGASGVLAADAPVPKQAKKRTNDADSDDSESEPDVHVADSSDEDEDASALKKAKAASDSQEKSELAAYLSTPSTYVSTQPHLALSREEIAERAEVEDLLARLKGHQKELMDKRTNNQKELDGMRGSLKKIRKETDELMKSQQTNLAAMGRKLH